MRCIEKEIASGVVRLRLIGDLDLASVPLARSNFRRLIDDGWSAVVLDLSSCDFVDSAGIGTIIGMRRRAGEADVSFVVANLGRIARVFEASGVQDLFVCADSVDMALSLLERIAAPSTGAVRPHEQD